MRALSEKMQQVVDHASRLTGKAVELHCFGEDCVLDEVASARLSDALAHLIRNAVDHGIESSEVRTAHKKPPNGRIKLSWKMAANRLLIEVSDDGIGIDEKALVEKAIQYGVLGPTSKPDREQSLALIFLPGLSTLDRATALSGRGVGMDAVRALVEELEGTIEVRTDWGQGTCFSIDLPAAHIRFLSADKRAA